jgi:hypothetical protein
MSRPKILQRQARPDLLNQQTIRGAPLCGDKTGEMWTPSEALRNTVADLTVWCSLICLRAIGLPADPLAHQIFSRSQRSMLS